MGFVRAVGPPGLGGDTRASEPGYQAVYDADLQGLLRFDPHDKLLAACVCG